MSLVTSVRDLDVTAGVTISSFILLISTLLRGKSYQQHIERTNLFCVWIFLNEFLGNLERKCFKQGLGQRFFTLFVENLCLIEILDCDLESADKIFVQRKILVSRFIDFRTRFQHWSSWCQMLSDIGMVLWVGVWYLETGTLML